MIYIVGILLTAVLFLSLILLLAAKPEVSRKITTFSLAVAGISGFLIYGYGYLVISDNFVLAVIRALLAVCGSFVGKNDYDAFSSIPVMQTQWMQILCALIQVFALYTTASAVITSIGAEALKKLRLWLSRRRQLNLIYGVNKDTLDFGKELLRQKQGVVVFVADHPDSTNAAAASYAGCVLRTDAHALSPDGKFLRSIGFGKRNRKLNLYALDKNSTANIRYAQALLIALEACNTAPEQLQLVILGQEELAVSRLQVTAEQYGYGFVAAVNEPQMAARLLTLKYPPCNTVSFDENGKATEDFEALVIGFGQVGQAVLKSLVMNGQFEGSHFRAAVFAPDTQSIDGSFSHQFHQLSEQYSISFYDADARSRKFYEYLNQRADKLKYVAVCTGSEKINYEIAEELTTYFQNSNLQIPVYKCSRSSVEAYGADGTVTSKHKIYSFQLLCSSKLDQMAMILNHRYQGASPRTPLENWMVCDYFSRQSCRAATDFIPAMLQAAHKEKEQVLAGNWQLSDMQKENLSKTEHLRWCAFHYCMGFSPMSDEEFASRAEIYRQQMAQDGKASIRIGKNMPGRTHACLVSWDDLELLSEKEAAVTGKYVDYKAMDTENILAIPELLQTS